MDRIIAAVWFFLAHRELALLNARSMPVLARQREVDLEKIHYPHVYDSRAEAMKTSAFIGGAKVGGTVHLTQGVTCSRVPLEVLLLIHIQCLKQDFFAEGFKHFHLLCCGFDSRRKNLSQLICLLFLGWLNENTVGFFSFYLLEPLNLFGQNECFMEL